MITRGSENHLTTIETALARGEAARSPVVASWSRSARLHGLDPTKPSQPDRMTAQELSLARERTAPLIRAAAPNLDRLFQAVGAVGCCVLLADLDGVPLERRGAAVDDSGVLRLGPLARHPLVGSATRHQWHRHLSGRRTRCHHPPRPAFLYPQHHPVLHERADLRPAGQAGRACWMSRPRATI